MSPLGNNLKYKPLSISGPAGYQPLEAGEGTALFIAIYIYIGDKAG